MKLINSNKFKEKLNYLNYELYNSHPVGELYKEEKDTVSWYIYHISKMVDNMPIENVIPIDQLLSILPKYDDYIHTKTYPYNETMEDIYSQGYEDGWNVCLKHIKEELDYWEKENE